MNRVDASVLAGGIACALTLSMAVWPVTTLYQIYAIPLGFGIFITSLFAGRSLHGITMDTPFLILASIVNGILWIAAVRSACWCRDFVRTLRSGQ